jgi:hypothetical protein
LIRRFKDIEE